MPDRGEGRSRRAWWAATRSRSATRNGPRIRFFLTSGQAEAEQFAGRGEGSEQIESALLFVREGSEQLLEDVEECLDNL